MMGPFECVLAGVTVTVGAQWLWHAGSYAYAEWRKRRVRRPSQKDVDGLLTALSDWADDYREEECRDQEWVARRDLKLYLACTKVGLMWIRPSSEK